LPATGLERLGDGDAAIVEVACVAFRAEVVSEDADAGLVRVQAREQRRARGAAARGVIELRAAQAAGGQAIEVGCLDFAAIAADIGEAHVIVEDQNDVGFAGHG
jgi:hypothetical protein